MKTVKIMIGARRSRQRGLALVFVLLIMMIATGLAVISARTTLMSSQVTRFDRDRQVAFAAAEIALNDAELDLFDPDDSTVVGKGGRACVDALVGQPDCGAGNPLYEGFCAPTNAAGPASSKYYDLFWNMAWGGEAPEDTGENDPDVGDVVFGSKTGREMEIGVGVAPKVKPRYLFVTGEISMPSGFENPDPSNGGLALLKPAAFKAYAIGYGINRNTQVMLEGQFFRPLHEAYCEVLAGQQSSSTP